MGSFKDTSLYNDDNLTLYLPFNGNRNIDKGLYTGGISATGTTYVDQGVDNSESIYFNGSSRLSFDSSSYLTPSTVSYAFWIKMGDVSVTHHVLGGLTNTSYCWYIGINNQINFSCVWRESLGTTTTANLQNNTWYHIGVTYNASTGALVIYLNGNNIYSTTNTVSYAVNQQVLGYNYNSYSPSFILEEWVQFNRILNESEFQTIYNAGTPSVNPHFGEYIPTLNTKLLINFNSLDGTDTSGNNKPVTTTTDVVFDKIYGRFNAGANFNGSSSKIYYSGNTISIGTSDWTVICWFKTTFTTNSNEQIIFRCDMATGTRGIVGISWNYSVTYDKKIRLSIYDGTTIKETFSLNAVNDGLWHCAIGTRVGTNLYLYIDGKYNSTTGSSGLNIPSTNQIWAIGSSVTGSGYFSGQLDQCIFETGTGWSETKIKKYYTYTKGMFGII
jgi:hypothetical protein